MQRFRKAVEALDLEALEQCLAEDVVFHSPAVWKPYKGRAVVGQILRAAASTFQDFRYVADLHDDAGQGALVFRARVGDRELDGIDFGRVDPQTGLVTHLTVFIRPLSGAHALAEVMAKKLAAAGLGA